jgi:glucosamine-6-phosphate deaminase
MHSLYTYENLNLSSVERSFAERSGREGFSSRIPYIVVPNFPNLGLFTALRFLEWVAANPNGTISLPTGKTPEHFIKWTQYLLENWRKKKVMDLMHENGLSLEAKPDLKDLHFIQIDEFYPISPKQRNSFYNYVVEYYIKGFGLDPANALLINSEEIPLFQNMHFSEVFPDNRIDLSLRQREPKNQVEAIQQKSIFKIDNWCTLYEEKIRQKGGIGFFLGGIGPDGHIAFNTRGSDHNSTARLTETNFETQAASASDLGGIEVSRNRLVITIGLGSITSDPEGTSIIFAAGEAKAPIVRSAIESGPDNMYPATVLQRQKNARFYITEGASKDLADSIDRYYKTGSWTEEKTERAVWDLCQRIDKYAHKLELKDLENDPYCRMIPDLSLERVKEVIDTAKQKIGKGMEKQNRQVYLHTGPHHDDIMLGIFPLIIPHLREPDNDFYFSVLTSGFTAVTNMMIRDLLQQTQEHIRKGMIRMIEYEDFFDKGYKIKWDKDVNHYLNKVAEDDEEGKLRGICHRMVRAIVEIYRVHSKQTLEKQIENIIEVIDNSYDGQKNGPDLQALKGMLREFEEELVWAHYGVQVKNIKHLRLGFYTGDIFTQLPERKRDVEPILEMLRKIKPTVISLAFDPEGSGPDTHYKVLQAIAEALRQWRREEDLSGLKIIGYRNVWYKFQPHEANVYTPVSLNSMAVLQSSFKDCYISQVNASFPSYEFDGPFSELAQRIWVEQFKKVQLILGKDFFYENEHPKYRATHGMIFYREMNLDEFLVNARKLEESVEGVV